jgi:hypothetical protein
MHKLNHDSTFTDARGNSFHGAVPHIADYEDSGHVRFEQTGVAVEGPGRGPLSGMQQVRPRKNEPALIALNRIAEPFRSRLRADEDKQA